MNIHFLEIVTKDVDKHVGVLSTTLGVSFNGPVAEFGNAMVAVAPGGGRVSIRAPMHDEEAPTIRPYMLTNDIEAAVKSAEEAGAMIAMAPTHVPGQGTFAIYFVDDAQLGLWQV